MVLPRIASATVLRSSDLGGFHRAGPDLQRGGAKRGALVGLDAIGLLEGGDESVAFGNGRERRQVPEIDVRRHDAVIGVAGDLEHRRQHDADRADEGRFQVGLAILLDHAPAGPDEFDELVTMMASGLAVLRLVSWTRKSVSLNANFSVMMISPAKFSFLNSASTAA